MHSCATDHLLVDPPSPNVTLDTDVDFGVLSSQQRVRSLVSTIDGPFCYVYD
jgi:tyrosinase